MHVQHGSPLHVFMLAGDTFTFEDVCACLCLCLGVSLFRTASFQAFEFRCEPPVCEEKFVGDYHGFRERKGTQET